MKEREEKKERMLRKKSQFSMIFSIIPSMRTLGNLYKIVDAATTDSTHLYGYNNPFVLV